MGGLSERTFRILTGIITILFGFATVVLGVKIADGALRADYEVQASFSAAGQGLITDSDVKIHGYNIGRVANVSLRDGRALVRMEIDDKHRIPTTAKATIRPKTLFGEKFVDIEPGAGEGRGPYIAPGGRIDDTLGGFELEKVLSDLYPILQAVDPIELAVILDTLAQGGAGLGGDINRAIANFAAVADVQASRSRETAQFLSDLALLSEELARRADDIVAGAKDLNVALPALNQRDDELAAVLDQLARLSGDVADVLEANRPFMEKAVTKGGKTLQVLYDNRGELPGFLTGLRQFVQTLAEVGRIPYGDGTNLAAVKLVLGEDCPAGRPCAASPSAHGPAAAGPAAPGVPGADGGAVLDRLPVPTTGVQALTELLGGVFRR